MSIEFEQIEEFQTDHWKQKMEMCGQAMANRKVRQTVFVHGTFVGGDPVGILGVIKSFGVSSKITALLEKTGKSFNDLIVKDLGNFTKDYVSSYSKAINHNIKCWKFDWSSENNHIGRLLSAPKLARELAKNIGTISTPSEDDRILLIGHSHAGQIFALLTVFLESSDKANNLLSILLETDDFDKDQFTADLKTISTIQLDIVTLGTPVRYRWGNYNKYDLLNIVNHRSASKIDGVLTTRDGDYVQQWGTDGKDLSPLNISLINLNNKLDGFLDKGVSKPSSTFTFIYQLLTKRAESKRRQALKENGDFAGNSIFINYKDNEHSGKNDPIDTLFGHGIYTQTNSMLFNTNTIVKSLYSET